METLRTPLGHVTMVPKGTYNSITTYNRLDLVTYTDNDRLALYIAKEDNLSNVPPSTTTSWMKVIDSSDLQGPVGPQGEQGIQGETGDAAGFGLPTGTATVLDPGASPTISITSSGDNTEKIFKFDFGIPQGPTGPQGDKGDKGNTGDAAGFGLPTGSVTMLDPGSSPSITISPTGPDTVKIFDFNFNIPKGDTGPRGETGLSIVTNPIHLELTNDQLDFGLFESSVGSGDSNIEFRITPSNQQVGVFITRYALPNSGESLKRLTLLDTSGNSSFPGNLQIAGSLNLPYNPLSIENGGTGASTSTSALTNLGALPLSGGTMTGQLILSSSGLKVPGGSGYTMDNNGNFNHSRNNVNDYWTIKNNEQVSKFNVYWETGNVSTFGTITYNPSDGVRYIQGVSGMAGIFSKKPSLNSNNYIPAITIQTNEGGGWSIGNYSTEDLLFTYGTKENIDNNTNTVYNIKLPIATGSNYIFAGKAVPASQEPAVNSALATNTVIFVYEE